MKNDKTITVINRMGHIALVSRDNCKLLQPKLSPLKFTFDQVTVMIPPESYIEHIEGASGR